MTIEKKPFRSYTIDEDKQQKGHVIVSVKLNIDQQAQLVKDKKMLRQPKDSTAIKQLMAIGSEVIHDPKIGTYLDVVLENKRKNERLGLHDYD